MASASISSLFLALPVFPCQIAGRPTLAPTSPPGRLAPAPRIRSSTRFACARCEAALVPAWRVRAPPRRRNVLRDKASPPLVVRPPSHEALHSRHQSDKDRPPLVGRTGEPQPASSDDHALPDPEEKSDISVCLDAGPSGNAVAESNLDGQKDLDWDAEESHFCGNGTGPVFSVYEDPDGNAVHVEVNEDEIFSRCASADGEGSGDLQSILSRTRVMAEQFESAKREVPKNSSLFRFVAAEKKKSCVADTDASVVQTNGTPSRAVAWGGFAAFCGVCIVLIASKLIWRNIKVHFSSKLFHALRPGMKAGQLDKGNIKVISNAHKFPGDLLVRPQLERRELMNNLKKAKMSRERFSFRNIFSCSTVANDDIARITEIRRMVTDVHTLEEGNLRRSKGGNDNSVVFPHPVVATEETISASYVGQSIYVDDVSELVSSELPNISSSNGITEESVKQPVDFKNGAPIIDISVKNQYVIGAFEQPEYRYNDESTADAKDRTSFIHATEKELHICSADDHNVSPNTINTPSPEFERKEQFAEVTASIQGLEPSELFSSDEQMIRINDSAHQTINNVVPETTDVFSPNCFNISSSGLKYKGASLANSENDINCMQETEAPTTFANDAQTANCEDFAHCVRIIGTEAGKDLLMTDISTMKSPQLISKEPVDLTTDNMQSMQEPEPSNHDDKQISYANVRSHKIDIVHNETRTSLETVPLYALQEETVQHKGAEVEILEKQVKITSSNKEARAYLKKDKAKLQKEMCSDKLPGTKLSAEGVPGTGIVVDPSNGVQKTKKVARKRLKKVQINQGVAEIVAEQDVVHNSSMVDQVNSSQNVKRTRRGNQTNAFRTQGSQTREEIPETALMASLPDDAPRSENMKPLGDADSSAGALSSKDVLMESQPSRFSARRTRKEELKLNCQTSERVEAATTETKTNMHDYNVMHEGSTDFNKSKTKMGVAAAKKSTKRKSLSKRTKPSNAVSNKDSKEPTGD
ncbi:hypothetical protein CFC21_103569 [Triticum aestivum]|uniref:Uncharacterized protein n=2 Tax=Triticum aestivum TaxID=4565 RepID=A0A9R1N6H9_WHEAT|nr:uncharacterized protein LOC123159361 [Triticum aestivum]KAF7102430.1 hypothetical protein CFC21_103569 [Triticum aestivum]